MTTLNRSASVAWDLRGLLGLLLFAAGTFVEGHSADATQKNLGLQMVENLPMEVITREPPDPVIPEGDFEVREGFKVIASLEELRAAIKGSYQKIRLRPGIYRITTPDKNEKGQFQLMAVEGSNNVLDLRGVVLETPLSAQNKLPSKAHTSVSWRVNGSRNTFIGGYFRNVLDMEYPKYRVTDSEIAVYGDDNRFFDCTFVIKGSIPYGYTDFYGKGGPNFGVLDKHSFMGIINADRTRLIRCQVYQQSFGHAIHLHSVNGLQVKGCFLSGALRPTNDIYKEVAGRAKEYDFKAMYRSERPIPRDRMIPLTEDGIRAYEKVENVIVEDTIIERMRGCVQLLCIGDVRMKNVTVREAGDFGFDVSAGRRGRVTLEDCHADLAYNPIFNLSRGDPPRRGTFEVTLHDPPEWAEPTERTGLGTLCGEKSRFTIHDGTTRPLPEGYDTLVCGANKPLTDSRVTNLTNARVILTKRVTNCVIRSVGPVEDRGKRNRVFRVDKDNKRAKK